MDHWIHPIVIGYRHYPLANIWLLYIFVSLSIVPASLYPIMTALSIFDCFVLFIVVSLDPGTLIIVYYCVLKSRHGCWIIIFVLALSDPGTVSLWMVYCCILLLSWIQAQPLWVFIVIGGRGRGLLIIWVIRCGNIGGHDCWDGNIRWNYPFRSVVLTVVARSVAVSKVGGSINSQWWDIILDRTVN